MCLGGPGRSTLSRYTLSLMAATSYFHSASNGWMALLSYAGLRLLKQIKSNTYELSRSLLCLAWTRRYTLSVTRRQAASRETADALYVIACRRASVAPTSYFNSASVACRG
ncbi:hypothetical protein BHM03_00003826 [Ensete ventricosum]|nr:hypothetical protein BHM03_00003826 [Ensete ventricosum]